MSDKTTRRGLEVGGVYALGLHNGACPVGKIIAADEEGVTVALFDWLVGMFVGPDRWIEFGIIKQHVRGLRRDDGVFDMGPLARFQTKWVDSGKDGA